MKSDNNSQKIKYDDAVTYVINKFQKNKIAVLASCGVDMHVSARSMSIIHDGLDIWFQTDRRFKKKRQIAENPYVALCIENIQIEGKAEQVGHSSREENKHFCEEFAIHHSGSYNAYTNTRDEVVYRVTPKKIVLWRYDNGKSYRDVIDVQKKEALREYYTVEPL
ncbi:MAG: pyridoxamine 5'-phosphate oxidase family protein [Spirochaetes bacterium]|jgi:general stress protein 26|nr:pyridoxamine 5'-phosphate oxidase family protein [Spirochaetota bacterium]